MVFYKAPIGYSRVRVRGKITFDMLESENIYGRHRINTKLTIPYQLYPRPPLSIALNSR